MPTFVVNTFCRKGPSVRYFDVTDFETGEQVQVQGRNDTDPRWWWVLIPNTSDHCWVSSIAFEEDANMEILPIQPFSNLPDPPAFFDGVPTCKPNDNVRDVKLSWSSVDGATGYRIYRNSSLIETTGAEVGIYVDTVPYTQGVTYELEAINKEGASEKVTTISGACQ